MIPSIIYLGIAVGLILAFFVFIYLRLLYIYRRQPDLEVIPYDPKNVSKADAKAISKALKTKFKCKKIGTAKVRQPKPLPTWACGKCEKIVVGNEVHKCPFEPKSSMRKS